MSPRRAPDINATVLFFFALLLPSASAAPALEFSAAWEGDEAVVRVSGGEPPTPAWLRLERVDPLTHARVTERETQIDLSKGTTTTVRFAGLRPGVVYEARLVEVGNGAAELATTPLVPFAGAHRTALHPIQVEGSQQNARVVVTRDGHVVVPSFKGTNEKGVTSLLVSKDGGRTFASPVPITDASANRPFIGAMGEGADGLVLVAYRDSRIADGRMENGPWILVRFDPAKGDVRSAQPLSRDANVTFSDVQELSLLPSGGIVFGTAGLATERRPGGSIVHHSYTPDVGLWEMTPTGEVRPLARIETPEHLRGVEPIRKWRLATSPTGAVGFVFAAYGHNIPAEVWETLSTDGGRTFPPLRNITGLLPPIAGVFPGKPVVDALGVMHLGMPSIKAGSSDFDALYYLRIAPDEGPVSITRANDLMPLGELPRWYYSEFDPLLAGDRVWLVWNANHDAQHRVWFSESVDGGFSFGPATRLTARDPSFEILLSGEGHTGVLPDGRPFMLLRGHATPSAPFEPFAASLFHPDDATPPRIESRPVPRQPEHFDPPQPTPVREVETAPVKPAPAPTAGHVLVVVGLLGAGLALARRRS